MAATTPETSSSAPEPRGYALFLFAVLLLLCGLLGWLFVTAPPAGVVGGPHPEFATMQVGGAPTRHETTLLPAFLFVLLQVLVFAGLLYMAVGRRLSRKGGALWLAMGTGALLTAFVCLFITYRGFLETGSETALAFSFPVPSAWMLYGVWTAPLFFIALYVVRFDDWILLPEDRKRFEELVAEKNAAADKGGA